MNYIDSFYNFVPNDGSVNMNELFSLNESGTSARYNKEEFKALFRDSLLESEGYVDDDLLEGAHAYYELGVLYEHKSEWVEAEGNNIFLDCDSHVILIKNGSGYMIEKNTLDAAKSLNEGALSWLEDKWNKAKEVGKAAIKKTVAVVKGGWDKLSYGAKKAWEFVKSCASAVAAFIKGMTWVEWAALAMSLLSAIMGIVQAALIGSGVASWVSPAAGILAGIFQAIGGGLHLYEGGVKIKNAGKVLSMDQTLTPTSKMAAKVAQGLPEYIVGSGMVCLGIYDIVKAATSPINPTTGAESVAVGTSAKTSLKSVAKTVAKPGGAIHHFIEHAGVDIMKKMGVKVASDAGKAAVGKIFTAIVSTVASSILSQIFGKIWGFVLKSGESVAKGFDFLINIPKKISEGIGNFVKKSKGSTFFSIIAKGLSNIVKPMTDSAAKVIAKYIQPTVNNIKGWFAREIKSYNDATEIIKHYKHELHSGTKGHEMKPHGKVEVPNQPKHGIDVKKVTKKDIKIVKKAVAKSKGKEVDKKKKVKESLVWERKHVQSFDDLNFI
jgi:hypothetical protein